MTKSEEAPFAFEGLDRTIHEKARLGILTSLLGHAKGLAFSDLRRLCGLTDGNLGRHLEVLEQAGLVEISKTFERNRPLTTCRLTSSGQKRLLEYLDVLEGIVRAAEKRAKRPASTKRATA